MGVNFNLNTVMFSLKTACDVTIVHELINAVGVKHRYIEGEFTEETISQYEKEQTCMNICKVLENVNKLPLPDKLKHRLRCLVNPMYDDLHQWYNDYFFFSKPILSPFGNVDMLKSSRKVVNERGGHIFNQFLIACEFCHIKEIFELAQQLTDHEILAINSHGTHCQILPKEHFLHAVYVPLTKFWLSVFNNYGTSPQEEWSQDVYHEGLRIALENNCSKEAVKFFIDYINPVSDNMLLLKSLAFNFFSKFSFSPAILYTMVCKTALFWKRDSLLVMLFLSLICWPYQPLLLDVARALYKITPNRTVRELMFAIVRRVGKGFNDYDYFQLFTQLTELYKGRCGYKREGLVYLTLLIEDERWLAFVCGTFSEYERKYILRMEIYRNVCMKLLRHDKLHRMETFIRYCGGEDKSWLSKCSFYTPQIHEGSSYTDIKCEFEDAFDQPMIRKLMGKVLKTFSVSGKVVEDLDFGETALLEKCSLDN